MPDVAASPTEIPGPGQDPSLIAVRQALQQYEGDPATVIDEPGIAAVLEEALNRTALT